MEKLNKGESGAGLGDANGCKILLWLSRPHTTST